MTVAAKFAQAVASLQQGRTAEATTLCADIIRAQPEHADALHVLGILAIQGGDAAAGIGLLRKCLRVNPQHAFAHCNLGNALRDIKQPDSALESYRRSLLLMPSFAGAYYGQGNALMDLERVPEALASFERAILLQPDYPEAHNNRGNALLALGETQRALQSYRGAVKSRPNFDLALANCAKTHFELGEYPEALGYYDRLLLLQPTDAQAHGQRAQCLMGLDRSEDALESFDRAIMLDPDNIEAWYGRGTARRTLKRYQGALEDFERARTLAPASVDILYRRAEALRDLKRPAEAAAGFAHVLELAPERDYALGNLMHARLQICDWTDYSQNVERAVGSVAEGKRVYLPGPFFSVSQSAASQLQCARLFAERKQRTSRPALWRGERYVHDKIRVAYISADFRQHPVSILLVGVLEHHDRRRFEITGISLLPEEATSLGQRVKGAFDRFIDVSRKTDSEIAALLRELEIDIAVDLMGLTASGRPAIFAYRPAPVQVLYLGYTGTTASPDVDYLIADPIVIRPDEQTYYTEQVVYLPECYQPSDGSRLIAAATPTRAQCGLPEQGFVFCCFNTHYKISPPVFTAWMELLKGTPGSVLWLSSASPEAECNLRREAAQLGVAPDRLVFAGRLAEAEEHLARYRLADLFLDTLPFNAHATASDALWAGLPVLTCLGGTFAGRVAASLLTAIGVPELVTSTIEEYQALAQRLAAAPALLAELRSRLLRHRNTQPLFDTARYCIHLESAFLTMWQKSQCGETPAPFAVPPATIS